MVCQLRSLVVSLGLNNLPRIVKLRIKKIRRSEQRDSQRKRAGAGYQCFAKLRAPTPRYATTGISPSQTALNCRDAPDIRPFFISGIRPVTKLVSRISGIRLLD
jgi:hypothetical protein